MSKRAAEQAEQDGIAPVSDPGSGEIVSLPLEQLVPAEDNPRREVGDLAELAASIRTAGILQPLVVMAREDGRYLVVVGHRRLAAARVAGLTAVPAIVRGFTEAERLEAMAIENLAREGLSALEEAGAYRALVDRCGYSQRRLAGRVGRSQAHISRRLALLELPVEATAALDTGGISIEDAVELTKLKEHPERLVSALAEGTSRGAWDIRRAVEAQLQDQKRQEAFAELVAQAEAGAVPYLAMVPDQWGGWKLPGAVARLGTSWQGLSISEATHAGEPCHAVTIDPRRGSLVAICSDFHRHPEEAKEGGLLRGVASRNEDQKEEARRKRQHNKDRRAAEAERIAFMEKLVGGRIRQGDVVERLVGALLEEQSNDRAARRACELLGVEVPKGQYGPDAKKGLADYAAQGAEFLTRAGLALALGIAEDPLRSDYPSFRAAGAHFAYLERCGYGVSLAERLELKGKAPR